jgi:hypothetical protein
VIVGEAWLNWLRFARDGQTLEIMIVYSVV